MTTKMQYYMELHVGDVVRLKSGGPEMTVMEHPLKIAHGENSISHAICQWFDEHGKKSQGTFLVDTLEKVKNDK